MQILVVNSGSSSIKFSVFRAENAVFELVFDGELSNIGTPKASLKAGKAGEDKTTGNASAANLVEAIGQVFDTFAKAGLPPVEAVGYRVVHPGAKLTDHQRITPEVLKDLEDAAAFAPLHDPEAVEVMREGLKRFPDAPQFACFDTVFHRTMPEEATTYPIPESYAKAGVRRYGFHGLSCESVVWQMRQTGDVPKRLAIAHLGSGCSVTALLDGRSVDTSMGLTPTGGVVMGTRPGDLDPGLMLYLLRQQEGEKGVDAVESMLNHKAGMVALTGLANDMKAVRSSAAAGDARAVLGIKVFTRSITRALGGFAWLLGGLDAIVFTGGIGEHDAASRADILAGLEGQGIALDSEANRSKESGVRCITASHTQTVIFVVPAQEDLMIAMHVQRMTQSH
jgi:acetate kinase